MKTTLNLTISDEELIRAAWKNTPLGRSDSPADKELIEEIRPMSLSGGLFIGRLFRHHARWPECFFPFFKEEL